MSDSVSTHYFFFWHELNSLFIYSVDHYPNEDEKLRASSLARRRGGNCPNTLEVLEQLVKLNPLENVSLVLLAVLSSSSSLGVTQFIKPSFRPMVDLSHCIYREKYTEPASSYIIRSSQNDSRTIVNYNNLPEMTSQEFAAAADSLGKELTWCHFEVGGILNWVLLCLEQL